MKSERAMLEAAAEALGATHDGYTTIDGRSGLHNMHPCPDAGIPAPRMLWNPWADDGDAFRLAAHAGAKTWFHPATPEFPFGVARVSLNGGIATAAKKGPFGAAECLRHAIVIAVSGVKP